MSADRISYLADVFRNVALSIEYEDLSLAQQLIELALALRPSGLCLLLVKALKSTGLWNLLSSMR